MMYIPINAVILFISVFNFFNAEYRNEHRILMLKDTCKIIKRTYAVNQQMSILSVNVIDCETGRDLKVGILKVNDRISYTDTLGRFSEGLRPGTYHVKAGWLTYKLQTTKVRLKAGDSTSINFYLSSDPEPLE
jgi:hypothetical protein